MTHRMVGHGGTAGLPDHPLARVTEPAAECPVEITLAVLGGRWTTLVIRELLAGREHYTDLAAALPTLSDKVLSDRLARLTESCVVQRVRSAGWPPRVRYVLTDDGRALGTVMDTLWNWGLRRQAESAL